MSDTNEENANAEVKKLDNKYATKEVCLKAAKTAQKKIRKMKFDPDRDLYIQYCNDPFIEYSHKFTVTPYSNDLIGKDALTDKNGDIIIKSTYMDKNGYICSINRKQINDEVTSITLNCPNGTDYTEIKLNPHVLKNDMVQSNSIPQFMDAMSVLVETGANMKEIYENYHAFSSQGYDIGQFKAQELAHQEDLAIKQQQKLQHSLPQKNTTESVLRVARFLHKIQRD